jgi:HAD superfamily hydrolase (TIGR01509 family)
MNARSRQEIQLVIFDCDGVLVDSELITNRVFVRMLNEIGLPLKLEDMFEQFVGRSMSYCYRLIEDMLKKPLPATFPAELSERTTAALKVELKAVHGIEALIDGLVARGVAYCVASSGTHEKMQTTLGLTGLLPRFEGKLFSVTQVAHSKPAPDVYLYAARKYGVVPSACCVVEDTPTGVSAGVAAGMTVYGYAALTPAHRLREAGAHFVVNDLALLPALWFEGPSARTPGADRSIDV